MTPTPTIRVQHENFDLQAEIDTLSKGRHDIGAVVTFTGLCRDEGGTLQVLELEHYPGMAEAEMTRIATEAIERFQLIGLTAIHRYGRITPGDTIVLVIAAASHRQAAFDGANFVMDFLKTSAPFWKKEHGIEGEARDWVAARDADDAARKKWTPDSWRRSGDRPLATAEHQQQHEQREDHQIAPDEGTVGVPHGLEQS